MRNLVARRIGRAYAVFKDDKHWFSHSNPNTFRGMVMAQCNPAEITMMQKAQAS